MNNLPDQFSCLARTNLFLNGWLESGMARLNNRGEVLEMDEALAGWLHVGLPLPSGQCFSEIVQEALGGWSELWDEVLASEAPFFRRAISAGSEPPSQWYEVNLARIPDGWVVHLSSSLPPLQHLAEEGWDEYLRTEAARREMFGRLMRAEAQLDSLVHRWPGVIFTQRADFSFHFVSPRIEELTGIPVAGWEQQPHRFWQIVHEADAEELRNQIRSATSHPNGVTSTYRIRHLQTGKVAYILEHRQAVTTRSGLLLGYEGIWLDVTRQTIAEKRLSSAAWKETLALLTMGLAHDFSNVMAGIHSLSESFLAQVEPTHPFQEGLSLIKQNSLQASQVIHRIIHLHHGKTGERQYHNLNEIVLDLVDLVRKILPRRVQVEVKCHPQPLPLYADAVEFRQVIINLILNAADAMPAQGTIRFRSELMQEFPRVGHVHGSPPNLPAVCLSVEDSGCGIKASHLPLIFDPFFTTKAGNKGSGLGLYNARLFVEKHHGAIAVDSIEGAGTTFRIWLPLSDFTEAERSFAQPSARRSVLLVGQNVKFVDSTAEFLRVNGYHVVVTLSRDNALEILAARDYPFVGLIVQVEPKDAGCSPLFSSVRALPDTVKTVLEIVGRNQDEIETHVLARTDLIISADMPQSSVLERLNCLFKQENSST